MVAKELGADFNFLRGKSGFERLAGNIEIIVSCLNAERYARHSFFNFDRLDEDIYNVRSWDTLINVSRGTR